MERPREASHVIETSRLEGTSREGGPNGLKNEEHEEEANVEMTIGGGGGGFAISPQCQHIPIPASGQGRAEAEAEGQGAEKMGESGRGRKTRVVVQV